MRAYQTHCRSGRAAVNGKRYAVAMARADEHLAELLKLPPEARSAAAEALLVSLEDQDVDPDAAQAWVEEIRRRIEANEPGVPAEQVFAEGRERLKNLS